MALTFPPNPANGDTYLSYIWDGVKWGVQAGVGGVAGVSSLNTRTGPVTLQLADVTGATGSGATAQTSLGLHKVAATGAYSDLSGTPSGGTAGVSSFNTRTGDVTLALADVTAAGGAPLASPALTGTPAAPTPTASDNSTKLATTAFVAGALTAAAGVPRVSSFNTRTGAVTLTTADVTGAGGAPLAAPVFTGDARAVTPAAGDNDTSIATTAFVQTAAAPAANNVGRNLLHNGLFNVAQRGTGPWATNGFNFDRWATYIGAAGDSFSVAPAGLSDANRTAIGDEAARVAHFNTFTGGAAAGNVILTQQNIERVSRLSGKTVTVSFWAATGTALKLGVSIDQNFGTGGSPSAGVLGAGQAVTLSTTPTRYTMTYTLPSITGKTLGTNGDDTTALVFWYSAGSSSATRAGNIGVQSGVIWFWGVQLEVGSVATPLEKPDPQQDLAKCQRFYQLFTLLVTMYYAGAGSTVYYSNLVPVPMRAAPTVTVTSSGNGNITSPAVVPTSGYPTGAIAFTGTSTAAGLTTINTSGNLSADL